MGVVYLAMVQGVAGFHKLAVVKELKPELVEEPAFLTMFLDEARLAARLSHPNIVQTNEVGNDGDRYFLAMEYLEGRCLDHLRRRSKATGQTLTPAMQLHIISEMLAGLDHAHRLADFDGTALNIVHRDVSPQNVFVTFSGHVKLLDFGIAKASDSSHDTRVGILKGKVAYMSPEQARGQKVDARADVFSAGVMLWEAIAGRRLWNNQRDDEKLWALVAGDLPRASSVNPSVPAELDQICARAMAWNRDERYQSAGEFQRQLERYVASSGQTVSPGDLGAYVSALFREDRARASSLIEAYVARARVGATRDDLPVIDVSMRTPATRGGRAMSSIGFSMPGSEDPPSSETANAAVAAPSSQSQINRRSTPLIVTACTAVVTLVVGGVVALRSGDPPHVLEDGPAPVAIQAPAQPMTVAPSPVEAVPVQPAPAPPPPAPPPPAPGAMAPGNAKKSDVVKIEIRVSPSNASLWIDDAELAGNPFGGNYRRDSDVHHVRASAPGHVTKIVAITFDSNTKLDLSLERLQPTPERPSRPAQVRPATPQPPQNEVARPPDPQRAQPPSRPAAAPDVDPAGGNKPLRTIDPNNPYGANAGRAIDPSNPYGNAP